MLRGTVTTTGQLEGRISSEGQLHGEIGIGSIIMESGGETIITNTGMNAKFIDFVEHYDTMKSDMVMKSSVTTAIIQAKITDAKSYEVTSGTSLTGTVNANAGDIVIAVITVRSALTIPDNLTLLNTSEGFGDYPQTMSFAYERITEDGEYSYTVNQASAGRIYLDLISIKDVKEVVYNGDVGVVKTSAVSSVSITLPRTAHYIFGCSAVTWNTNSTTPWKASPTLEAVYLSGQPRQAVMYINQWFSTQLEKGTVYTFTPDTTSTLCCVDAVEIIFNE